jgi:hypothetical protein
LCILRSPCHGQHAERGHGGQDVKHVRRFFLTVQEGVARTAPHRA